MHSGIANTGKVVRLGRILNPETQRAAVVAFDHGVHLGIIPGIQKPGNLLEALTEAGADAFLVAPGTARRFASVFAGRGAPALIARLDWTNRWRDSSTLGNEEGRGRLIGTVEGAARLGADAVLVYLFLGYGDPDAEARQVADVSSIAEACENAGIGCIIEPMPRGTRVGEQTFDAAYVSLGARIACELGADILKTDYTGNAETFRRVVEASFRPILIAGGPKAATLKESFDMVRGALEAGANGMFIGRNVFQSENPSRMMRAYHAMIHRGISTEDALTMYQG
jgi:class I fructose-bisphosphate aldolase